MMNKEFVPYEEAMVLNKLGFINFEIFGHYIKYKSNSDNCVLFSNTEYCDWQGATLHHLCNAPLYQQVFKWFRDEHKLWCFIYPRYNWNFCIQSITNYIVDTEENIGWNTNGESHHGEKFDTYDETQLECLRKLIQLIK